MDNFMRKGKKKPPQFAENTSPHMLTNITLSRNKIGQEHPISGKFLQIRAVIL